MSDPGLPVEILRQNRMLFTGSNVVSLSLPHRMIFSPLMMV